MHKLLASGKRFITSEAGPTTNEYAVMLALIVLAIAATVQLLGDSVSSFFMTLAEHVGDVM